MYKPVEQFVSEMRSRFTSKFILWGSNASLPLPFNFLSGFLDVFGRGIGSMIIDLANVEPGDVQVTITGPLGTAYLTYHCPTCGIEGVEEQYFLESPGEP
jgi:hypothetical protein